MKQAPRDAQPGEQTQVGSRLLGLFLGLPPLLLLVGACVWLLLEGRCQPHPQSILLPWLSLLLWGVEFVVSLIGLFVKRIQALSEGLLITLLLSLFVGGFLFLITFQTLLCFHLVG